MATDTGRDTLVEPQRPQAASKPRVVICDDELHLRELFKIMMTSLEVEVAAVCSNGQEAIDIYRKVRPHLLLLDINMPGMTGDEALEVIMAEFPFAFVIMLTSVSDLDTVKKCLGLGASNYILKDTPISEMKKIIQETWKVRLQKARKRNLPPKPKGQPPQKTVAPTGQPPTKKQAGPGARPAPTQGPRPKPHPGGPTRPRGVPPKGPAKRPNGTLPPRPKGAGPTKPSDPSKRPPPRPGPPRQGPPPRPKPGAPNQVKRPGGPPPKGPKKPSGE